MIPKPQIYFLFFLILAGSFVITYLIMPRIIGVVKYKSLMENQNQRSSHKVQTPSLGGIAFYISMVLGLYFLRIWDENSTAISLFPGLLILFIIGLKDDLVVLGPTTKIIAQICAISFILIDPQFHIKELNGFFGLYEISPYISIPLAGFVMLTIINAFNLIDGIDGLASIVGIIIFSIFGILFFMLERYFMLGICLIMVGSLTAFLRFNLSASKKIFMGDTGSLLVGFIIAVATVRLFAIHPHELKNLPFQMENLPLVVMAILIVPFFDTARVFTIRIMNKKGPFYPDRNHIHHILIDSMKLSHRRASFIIGFVNMFFIIFFIILSARLDDFWMLCLMLIMILGFIYLFYRINFSYNNLRRRLNIRKKSRRLRNVKFQ